MSKLGLKLFYKILFYFPFVFSVALQSLKDLGRVTYKWFLELFRHTVGLLGRVIIPSQGLYLHRTTLHRKMRTNIHALIGIRTHDPSNQPAKTHASDFTATVTGSFLSCFIYLFIYSSLLRVITIFQTRSVITSTNDFVT
jgi:hypothetical protein